MMKKMKPKQLKKKQRQKLRTRRKTRKRIKSQQRSINGNFPAKTKNYGHVHRAMLRMMSMMNSKKH
jgi:hypothetical protein